MAETRASTFDVTVVVLSMFGLGVAAYTALMGRAEIADNPRLVSPELLAQVDRLFVVAAVIAVSVPLVGLLLSLRWGGRGARWLLAGLLVLGVTAAVAVGLQLSRDDPDPQYRIETESCPGDRTEC